MSANTKELMIQLLKTRAAAIRSIRLISLDHPFTQQEKELEYLVIQIDALRQLINQYDIQPTTK